MKKARNLTQIKKALAELKDKVEKMKEDSELEAINKELEDMTPTRPIAKFTKTKPNTKLPKADEITDEELAAFEAECPDDIQNDTEELVIPAEGDIKADKETAVGGKKKKNAKASTDTEGEKVTTPSMKPQVKKSLKDSVDEQLGKLAPKVKVKIAKHAEDNSPWLEKITKGGPGSGNFGHSGIPGHQGGSGEGGSSSDSAGHIATPHNTFEGDFVHINRGDYKGSKGLVLESRDRHALIRIPNLGDRKISYNEMTVVATGSKADQLYNQEYAKFVSSKDLGKAIHDREAVREGQ